MFKLFVILFALSFQTFAGVNTVSGEVSSSNIFDFTGSYRGALEANFYNGASYVNTTLGYTTKDKLDVAFIVKNINLGEHQAQTLQNDAYIGVSKFFKLTDTNAIVLGAQQGYTLNRFDSLHVFDWADYRIRPVDWFIVHGGLYYANGAITLTNGTVGAITGIEFNGDKLKLTLDWISGHSNVSGAFSALTYKGFGSTRPYIGIGVPERKSGNEFYGSVGVSASF